MRPLPATALENPKDRGAWQATVHGMAKSQTQLGILACITWWKEVVGRCSKPESAHPRRQIWVGDEFLSCMCVSFLVRMSVPPLPTSISLLALVLGWEWGWVLK